MKKRGSPDVQAFKREMVILFLVAQKGTQRQAAELYQLAERSVRRIWKAYKTEGKKAMAAKKRGVKKKRCPLNATQAAQTRRLLCSRLPDALQLPFFLWTRAAVQALICQLFDLKLSLQQTGNCLKRWGFTPQRPARRAVEQNKRLVTQWTAHTFPRLCKQAKRQKAALYFRDEMGMRSDQQAGRSYAPQGKTPLVPCSGKRFGISMITALSTEGHLCYEVLSERFTAKVFVRFLSRLIRYQRRKIIFITDGHPAHKAKAVQQWLKANCKRIEVHFLPPYSPELNVVEYMNGDVKANVAGKQRATTKEELHSNVEAFMQKRKKDPAQIRRYFEHEKVRYAA